MDSPADSRLPTLDRKIQKTGSGCKVALRHHKTATPGNDSVSRRQFQYGSLALWPGGKKLVNMRQDLRRNITACQVLHHGSECGHNPVEIHLHQLQQLTPAQRQQLIRERRGLFAGELNLFGATNLVRHSRLTLPQSAHCLIEFGDIEYCADQ